MQKLLPLLLLCFLAVSCGGDASADAAAEKTPANTEALSAEAQNKANEDRMNQIAPPPPICIYLTEAEVLSQFEKGVQVPMAGQRAPSSFNSCQYTLENSDWSGFLVLEMPEKVTKIQSIVDEVAGAKGKDAVKIGEFNGRIMNGGRILSVEAKIKFRVKFSALPKQGFPEPFDEAQRRELIIKLAEAVLAV
ncbi:MAG: hypothetical protein ACJAZ9_000582 [Neolewinella sp.]|jgi:hypothetical protein